MATILETLKNHNPCPGGRDYLGDQTDPVAAWDNCQRPDWMLWAAWKLGVDHRLIVHAAAMCARTALKYVPIGENRPLAAIEAAERWAENPTEENRVGANAAAYAADAAADAAYAAADAAYAVANAAAYAAYAVANAAAAAAYVAAYAAYAAANAADAAAYVAYAAANAADAAAYVVADAVNAAAVNAANATDAKPQNIHRELAILVREIIPAALIAEK
jgi:hypothetical protein